MNRTPSTPLTVGIVLVTILFPSSGEDQVTKGAGMPLVLQVKEAVEDSFIVTTASVSGVMMTGKAVWTRDQKSTPVQDFFHLSQ